MSDKDLEFSEYRILFGIARCVGAYDELVYFLPHAFNYVKNNPDDGFECTSEIIHFISSEAESLERDALIEPCRNEFCLWFEQWTRAFIVQHYDELACKEKGWVIRYNDIVLKSQFISDLIDDLVRHKSQTDLAEKMIETLAQNDSNDTRSAWLLEYAREVRVGTGSFEARGNPKIERLITNTQLLQTHYDRIANTVVAQEKSPTYWLDVCKALCLKSD